MENSSLQDTIQSLPHQPGVYLMKDRKGRLLYVGKAKVLSDRVRSYFLSGAVLSPRVQSMVKQVVGLEIMVTHSELEALILENNLIKKKKPRYNVILRDDKNYPYLKIPIQDAFPRLEVVRRVKNDGALYFGPYVPTQGLREALKLIHKTFPLATCEIEIDGQAPRACIEFEIKRCLAPCTGNQSQEDYQKIVQQVRLFLEGKSKELLGSMKKEMVYESKALHFEEAARLRDRIAKIERFLEKQRITSVEQRNLDVIAMAREGSKADIQIFFVRGGMLIGRKEIFLEDVESMEDQELLHSIITQFYHEGRLIPEKIVVSSPLKEMRLVREWLRSHRKGPVAISFAQKGKDRALVRLVQENARVALQEHLRVVLRGGEEIKELKKLLGIEGKVQRIEAFDISNIMGSHAVGSMVVWEKGAMRRKEYRHFKIRGVQGANDYAMLQEVLNRHYGKSASEGRVKPDLILIDGGKGQLSASLEILRKIGFHSVEVLGLAKAKGDKGERIFLPEQSEGIDLKSDSPATHLLQRIRDEAHRFAVTYHRKLRAASALVSSLDQIEGLGPVRKRSLLKFFGTVQDLGKATVKEIQGVKGVSLKLAQGIFNGLHHSS